MPKFLEDKLKAEYPNDPAAPYKVMNKIGAMKGNQETAKGRAMERKHVAKASKRSHSTRGQFTSDHAPAGRGSMSTRPRVITNPKSLTGRRNAAHAKAYPETDD